jgi:UDP-N-acetylglucosamine 2-epimerase
MKLAPVSKLLQESGHEEIIVHTGQHYDDNLSDVFFRELGIRAPDYNISAGSGAHGAQTARILTGVEEILFSQMPQCVVVYGDTNSTLAGALAAVKLGIPVAHVEAGLRSYNRGMPEEHNRVLTDHCADILFCPTPTSVANLEREGILTGVHLVGDTMYDTLLQCREAAERSSDVLQRLGLNAGGYIVTTLHRPQNVDVADVLRELLAALRQIEYKVVFPLHPRTARKAAEAGISLPEELPGALIIPPVGYLDMLQLLSNARMILTDSGGVQKEAFFLKVPCLTLRPESEWVETISSGWNRIVLPKCDSIVRAVREFHVPASQPDVSAFGDGSAAKRIVSVLSESFTAPQF